MARTAITAQDITTAGLAPATEAANVDGNSFPAGTILRVTNGSAGSINVTVPMPGQVDGLALPNRVVAVAAGETRYLSRFGSSYQQSDGSIHANYSAVTSVTVAALKP